MPLSNIPHMLPPPTCQGRMIANQPWLGLAPLNPKIAALKKSRNDFNLVHICYFPLTIIAHLYKILGYQYYSSHCIFRNTSKIIIRFW